MSPRWRPERPADEAWRPLPGRARDYYRIEQDTAADGHHHRVIVLPSGETALASVALRVPSKARRIYAYLRWYHSGKTHERFIGEVTQLTRAENLAAAWQMAMDDNARRQSNTTPDANKG